MLTSLSIENVALIERLRIDFGGGLTVMTGETGAGKSIVIDALGLVLGERADSAMVRDGAAKAVVEAEIDADSVERLRARVEDLGADWQAMLILRREVTTKGVSRCFVNDTPVSVAILKGIGDAIVDIHGQHEHQSLLRAETHLGILDAFASLDGERDACRASYLLLQDAAARLDAAERARDAQEERRAVIDHQLREMQSVNPAPDEDAEIERELRVAEHAEKIATLTHELLALLYDGDSNAVDALGKSQRIVTELSGIDETLAPLRGELEAAMADVEDVVRTLRSYAERVEYNPDRIEKLRHRLMDLAALKRKFRMSLSEILERRAVLEDERAGLENIDGTIAALERDVAVLRAEASLRARQLSASRAAGGAKLATAVKAQLKDLGIASARFETRLGRKPAAPGALWLEDGDARVAATEEGIDVAEFFLSTNVGEEVKPLVKVVSGGEVSRVMLALKSLFAGKASIPVMVFDEIDVGVSGTIAQKVGAAMRRLSRGHQVIAITHLPQIAACGDGHLLVEKRVAGRRTVTGVRALDADERVREIARLMSGEQISGAALASARELMAIHS
ncbi:MAG: DNA repair protein RecN [Ignavibacteria bacterium]|nr:DNA repair protein RecN [Ignavibacteria bacterium]